MIWLFVVAALIGLTVWAITSDWEELCIAPGLVTWTVLRYEAGIERIDRDIPIVADQYQGVEKIILYYASKYPIEEKLLTDLKPAILLKLPEIRGDEFLVRQIELAVAYKKRLYDLKLERNKKWAYLKAYSHRWFVPCAVFGSGTESDDATDGDTDLVKPNLGDK